MSDNDHAFLAPSSAARWVKCRASPMLEQQYPEMDGDGSAAAEGTAAHWAALRELQMRPVDPGEVHEGVVITLDMLDAVHDYASIVRSAPGVPFYETRVHAVTVHPDVWGTADCFKVDYEAQTVYLFDFKYGHSPVEAFGNYQLATYALAIAGLLSLSPEWKVVARIFQPRVYRPEGPTLRWDTTVGGLEPYRAELADAATEATGNNPSTVIGSHCKHCKARHICKALRQSSLEAVDQANDSTPMELTDHGLGVEMSLLVQAQRNLEARLSGLQAQAMANIREGRDVLGWGIEHNAGREEWTAKPAEIIAKFGKIVEKEMAVITPAQARKAGADANAVAEISQRKPGSAKLVQINTTKARKAFAQ